MNESTMPSKLPALQNYLGRARWFGGKGRDFTVTSTHPLPLSATVSVELVVVTYADGGGQETYQVPISYDTCERPDLATALIGCWDDPVLGRVYGYDALHDPAATSLWLDAFVAGTGTAGVKFHQVGAVRPQPAAEPHLLAVEQSNSSVRFGEDSLLKLFRKVAAGKNPDIEILAALTADGNPNVPALFGWCAGTGPAGEALQLGILQEFLTDAEDGWGLALGNLRNLFAAPELAVPGSPDDFVHESLRLGIALAEVHRSMAKAFPTRPWGVPEIARLTETMSTRLETAISVVPELAAQAAGLRQVFKATGEREGLVIGQRIHGDLHLGQTLRTASGWKLIDFEGEPMKSLEERALPDSPWRDVAGMVRSFDYAAETVRAEQPDAGPYHEELARDWAANNTRAFLSGYVEGGQSGLDSGLLRAYIADKAVYEAVYETRNRPDWVPIPLGAIRRLVGN